MKTKNSSFISLKGVTIRAHEHTLFENLDWEIKSGEQWAVIGPNGSGRSSLMLVIAGTLPISGGEIKRSTEDIEYVSFDTQRKLLPHETFVQDRWNAGLRESGLTVSDLLSEERINQSNRFELTKNKKDPTFAARRKKVINQMGLKPLLKETLIELSNGERRKTVIARALLKKPELLILDNPYEGLDEGFRKKLTKILNSLIRANKRLIVVGTERDEIPAGITHVILIKEGGKVELGPRKEMMKKLSAATLGKLPKKIPKTKEKPGAVIIEMKKVNVSYDGPSPRRSGLRPREGGKKILRNVNWTVREHERWALFGPNGAGKTTLLSLILADNPQAYANDIWLFGKKRGSGESIWEIKRNIGWVSPELQLYHPLGMTCLDVVCSGWFDSIGLYRQADDDQREIALACLQEFGVANAAGELFSNISEGEQRLTLLARAMAKHRDSVLEAIDSIEKATTTMIYVTHRADELPRSITNVLYLENRPYNSKL